MDYGLMLARHADSGADITVGTVEVPVDRAREFGVVAVDDKNRIKKFAEKPENPEPLPGRESIVLASMGIYVFNYDHLRAALETDARDTASAHDFGKNVIPAAIGQDKVMAYVFQDAETGVQQYWRDVGNVDAFYEANMELTSPDPELNLYDANWPIWTYQEQCPPAKFVSDAAGKSGLAIGSMVSGGCRVNGGVIRDSLLFSNVVIEEGAYLEGAVVLPNSRVEPGCRLRRVVIDDNCQIPAGSVIGEDHEKDAQRFFVTRNGVVLVTRQMLEA
jgi:glucose-1-phosphate adenylyltransferase